jgi:hypothetical protein
MSWASRAAANILPLSREKDDLAVALREWRYTGDYHDLETPCEDCELCDHPDIRYQFEIQNLHTANTLLVGSECINRFNIAATDEEGRTLDADGTRKKLAKDRRKLVDDARRRRLVKALVALAHIDREFNIHSFIDYLQKRDAFTPSQVSTLMWRFEQHGIDYNPRDFKLTIRRGREKAQLEKMSDWQLQRLLPCLSPSQRTYLQREGLYPSAQGDA